MHQGSPQSTDRKGAHKATPKNGGRVNSGGRIGTKSEMGTGNASKGNPPMKLINAPSSGFFAKKKIELSPVQSLGNSTFVQSPHGGDNDHLIPSY
jgi:hypothetical protein